MNIYYEDEYGVTVHSTNSNIVPRIGDSILFMEEDYRIKDITWIIERDSVVVTMTQNTIKSQPNGTDTRLAEVKNAIIKTNRRVEVQEKKNSALSEQLTSIKYNLKHPKETK